jgi:hypothetical protein
MTFPTQSIEDKNKKCNIRMRQVNKNYVFSLHYSYYILNYGR